MMKRPQAGSFTARLETSEGGVPLSLLFLFISGLEGRK